MVDELEKMMIRHDRRRWYILIIGSIAYLCSHSYLFATTATIAFDVVLGLACAAMDWPNVDGRGFVIDKAIGALCIVGGCTVNAFGAAIFDLSFLYGLQWLYFAIMVALYMYFRAIDTFFRTKAGLDYIFGAVALGTLVFFMNFVAYGEPYTFMVEMIYILSVIGLVAISDRIQWWAALVFFSFWIIAIGAGAITNAVMHKEYRRPLHYYFTNTPLID